MVRLARSRSSSRNDRTACRIMSTATPAIFSNVSNLLGFSVRLSRIAWRLMLRHSRRRARAPRRSWPPSARSADGWPRDVANDELHAHPSTRLSRSSTRESRRIAAYASLVSPVVSARTESSSPRRARSAISRTRSRIRWMSFWSFSSRCEVTPRFLRSAERAENADADNVGGLTACWLQSNRARRRSRRLEQGKARCAQPQRPFAELAESVVRVERVPF